MKRNCYRFNSRLSLITCIAVIILNLIVTNVHANYRSTLSDTAETCEQYVLRNGFADWPMNEKQLLKEDPTILATLIQFYEASEGQPYWFLIAENWMACGLYSLTDGRSYTGWQIGDLNLDGIVNYQDLREYAKAQMGV